MRSVKHYLAVADRAEGSADWSVLFPSFPGLIVAVAEFRDIARAASAALARALAAGGEGGRPAALEEGGPGPDDAPLAGFHRPRCFLIPVAIADDAAAPAPPKEVGGAAGPEPTRYGDWERKGRCTDF